MKKILLVLFIGFLSAAQAQSPVSPNDWTRKIQLYGHGFSVPTDFTDAEFEYIANTYKVFTVEKRHAYNSYGGSPSTERATIGTAAKLKEINPDIEVLLYWNAVMNYETLYEYNAEFGAHPEWVHSIWPTGYEIYDLENIDCRNWWVNSIVEIIEDGDLDGVFLDAGPKADASDLVGALGIAIDSVRARIGHDKIVIYNGYRVASPTNIQAGSEIGDHTSGVFIEFFLHAPLDTKEEAALLFDQLTDAYNDGKMIFPRGTPSSFLPGTALEDQFDFSFASFMLFYGPNTYWIYNEGYNKTEGMFDYLPEYYDKATGQSLGSPQRNGWVYTREFENASVRVDLENKTSSITWIENPADTTEAIENLAIWGTASQSSTNHDGVASRAIDGDTNGAFGQGSVTHTQSEDNPWWQVDLGASYHLGEIAVFNRTDAASIARLSNFTVYILDEDSTVVDSSVYTTYPDPSVTIDAGGVMGRFVRVQINGKGVLNLAEVTIAESKLAVDKNVISIKVTDDTTNDSITLASLEINNLIYTSNFVGQINLELPVGEYPYTLSKEGYYTFSETLSVTKDTAVVMQLEKKTQYALSYNISDAFSNETLSGVLVAIDNQNLTTDDSGDVSSLLYEGSYEYTLSKIGYLAVMDTLDLTKDTLVTLQMDKESYTLTFQVKNASIDESIQGVLVAINDSLYTTDAQGEIVLVLDYGEYDYKVTKEGYDADSATLFLSQDSLVTVLLSLKTGMNSSADNRIAIHPNPVNNVLMIDVEKTASASYEIYSVAGESVLTGILTERNNTIAVGDLLPGVYFVQLRQDDFVNCTKIVKRN